MELVEGPDMAHYLSDPQYGPPKSLISIKEIGLQIVKGISYLHDNMIVHQDLKPKNIMFTKDHKHIKLIDLGMSKNLF